jgi:hypothetical protein
MRRIIQIFLGTLLCVGAILVPVRASAEVISITADQKAQYTAIWDQWGVLKKTQSQLLAKLSAGQAWDSLKGGVAKSARTVNQSGKTVTVLTYGDGSIVISTIDNPSLAPSSSGGITPNSIGYCTITGGSYWYDYENCAATINHVIYGMEFYFSYQGGGSSSSITNYYGPAGWVTMGSLGGGSIAKTSSTSIRAFQNFNTPIFSGTICDGVTVRGASASEFAC